MNLLIDATNLINGGGVTHIVELINNTEDELIDELYFEKVYIVGVPATLDKINNRIWLEKVSLTTYSDSLLKRQLWKIVNFKRLITSNKIDMVFNPGGGYYSSKTPYITMCRNMLVFEKEESRKYNSFFYRQKFKILKIIQSFSFKNAQGIIFISNYAKEYVSNKINIKHVNSTVISHGVSDRFKREVKEQKKIESYNEIKPYNILYVSNTDPYKNHLNVAKAIVSLVENKNYKLRYTIVGVEGDSHVELKKIIQDKKYIDFLGKISFETIQNVYSKTDLFLFASTCENMPNILIEAMTSGLPIVCSEKQPMPEFLKDAAVFFNSNQPKSIENAIENTLNNHTMREYIAKKAKVYSESYSWRKCSKETFNYIRNIYVENGK